MNSTLPPNSFKRAITEGRLQVGIWSILSSHITVEVIAGAGFDWMVLDTEHAPNELPMVLTQLQAAQGGSAHPVVRIPDNNAVDIKRYLDLGVQTFLIPTIESAAEAAAAVAATRYPPRGCRGFSGLPRASKYGRIKGYPKICETEICVLLQIETGKGLENIEAIAAVEGVDGLFIGPGDLSASLGFLGDLKHPTVLHAIEDAIHRIKIAGRPCGILTADEMLAKHYIQLGCVFTAVGSDVGLLARGAEQLAAKFKK